MNADEEKKRNPFIAGLLSLISSGLGQLYNGQIKLALFFLIFFPLILLAAFKLPWAESFPSLFLFLVIYSLLCLGMIGQAILFSIRQKKIVLKKYNKIYIYFIFFLCGVLSTSAISYCFKESRLYLPFSIPSVSMSPSLMQGDYLMAQSNFSPPQRGDIFIYKLPSNPNVDFIKRIIGLPGETVQMKDGRLYINDEMIPRTYLGEINIPVYKENKTVQAYTEHLPDGKNIQIYEESNHEILDDTPVYAIPENQYFTLGDFRDNSQDSRVVDTHGFVPEENLTGKALYIFFSKNLSRIGKVVE